MRERGYVLASRHATEESQIEALEAAGVKVHFVEGKNTETWEDALRAVRPGRPLYVARLWNLAHDRDELRKRINQVHAAGGYIIEAKTKRDSREHMADMILDAVDVLAQRRKGHSPAKAREYGKRGGRKPKKREMSDADAEKVWFDLRMEHNDDAIERMPGWTLSAAYRKFGPSGRPSGPRPAKKQKR